MSGADPPLRIGLNLLYLTKGSGGAGRYASELMRAFVEHAPETRLTGFVTTHAGELLDEPWAEAVEWVRYDVPPGTRRALWTQMLQVPAAAARRRLDVLHSPANIGVLKTFRSANVVTLLDLIWLHPETSALSDRERFTTRLVFTRCARAADRVLTISEATKRDLVATIGLDPERIDVTPLGVADAGRAAGRGRSPLPPRPWRSAVRARRRPEAAAQEPLERDPGAPRARPGRSSSCSPGHRRRTSTSCGRSRRASGSPSGCGSSTGSRTRSSGRRPAARAFVLPSFIEGFGLPVLEAMQQGTPVACSRLSALPEVAGDAALLFDPADQQAVTDAVRRVLGDESSAASSSRPGTSASASSPGAVPPS